MRTLVKRMKNWARGVLAPPTIPEDSACYQDWIREQDAARRMIAMVERHREAVLAKRRDLLLRREPITSKAWVYSMGPTDFEECRKLGVDTLFGFKLTP